MTELKAFRRQRRRAFLVTLCVMVCLASCVASSLVQLSRM